MRLKGYTRTRSRAVVSMDATEYELIKRERIRKKSEDSLRGQVDSLKAMVMTLMEQVEALKRG